jgi:hypothetical protein
MTRHAYDVGKRDHLRQNQCFVFPSSDRYGARSVRSTPLHPHPNGKGQTEAPTNSAEQVLETFVRFCEVYYNPTAHFNDKPRPFSVQIGAFSARKMIEHKENSTTFYRSTQSSLKSSFQSQMSLKYMSALAR